MSYGIIIITIYLKIKIPVIHVSLYINLHSLNENFSSELGKLPPIAKDPIVKTLPPDMRKSSFEFLVMDVQRNITNDCYFPVFLLRSRH